MEKDFEFRRNAGELRGASAPTLGNPRRGIDESNGRVIQHSINDWTVNLDMDSTEYYAGEKIKRALARHLLHVICADVDPRPIPFGLQWDCYSDTPNVSNSRSWSPTSSGRGLMIREDDRLALLVACPSRAGHKRWRFCAGSAFRWPFR
ncbi:DUF2895 family protein [Pseudomonas aeruginosa]|nr:DUF2895 family protein [Pseudomonas aeruginosa]